MKKHLQNIDNREVNGGTYDDLGEKKYKLAGDNQIFEISVKYNVA